MKDCKVTQGELAERLGMTQGGVGHWLNKRRAPSLEDMNRLLRELGLGDLEVVLEIRERSDDEPRSPQKHYNPYFRYPVNEWKGLCEVREDRATYSAPRFELTDYLKEELSAQHPDGALFAIKPGISQEEALVHASDLLRSAAATAYESASSHQGNQRDLAFSVVYLIDMAKAMVERSLQAPEAQANA